MEDVIYCVFDVEIIGLFVVYDMIIEFVGVKMKNGEIIDKFEVFIDFGYLFFVIIINLIGIIDDMVKGFDLIDVVLKRFKEWSGDDIFVVYNVFFDMGFINIVYEKVGLEKVENVVVDILELVCFFYLYFKNYCLNILIKKFNIIFE